MYLHLEEYSLNAWPALQTVIYDGWLLRFNQGYTKRSNSIQTIYHQVSSIEDESRRLLLEDKITYCEQLYGQAGLATIFKLTPYSEPGLDQLLAASSYEAVDYSSVKVLQQLSELALPEHGNIVIEEQLTNAWLDAMAQMNGLSDHAKQLTKAMLLYSPLRKGYFVLYEGDTPVACGLAVIEHQSVGLYDIVTAPAYRNRGFAQQLILHILHWARSCGVVNSYLQVVQNNIAANRLYDKLGYEKVYEYWYRCKPIAITNEGELR